MKKTIKLLILTLSLLLPLVGCNNSSKNSSSSTWTYNNGYKETIILKSWQGLKITKYTNSSKEEIEKSYTITYQDTHITDGVEYPSFPKKPNDYTTISIDLYTNDNFLLNIEYNFSYGIYESVGYLQDNNGNWIAPLPEDEARPHIIYIDEESGIEKMITYDYLSYYQNKYVAFNNRDHYSYEIYTL